MAARRLHCGSDLRLAGVARLFPWACLLLLAGCAPLSKLTSRVVVEPATAGAEAARPVDQIADAPSLAAIVKHQLQRGHYAEGEKALRAYLAQHSGDRLAQDLLQQLTGDPMEMLGRDSRPYVVQAGDSYSSLAERYLGDAGRFLVLARYNGSSNPSILQLGGTLRLPTSAPAAMRAERAATGEPAAPAAPDSASLQRVEADEADQLPAVKAARSRSF